MQAIYYPVKKDLDIEKDYLTIILNVIDLPKSLGVAIQELINRKHKYDNTPNTLTQRTDENRKIKQLVVY